MLLQSYSFNEMEAGTDEAGRGCLASPVTAAAVILPEGFENILFNDSKLLQHEQRSELRLIIEEVAVCFAVSHIAHTTIDRINILNASILAMHNSLDGLEILPSFVIVDGNRFNQYKNIEHSCIVKGDSKYLSIAAASILAKTYRDEFMVNLHELHPEYNWKQNKGYPTREHRRAIEAYGPTHFHRMTFQLLPKSNIDI